MSHVIYFITQESKAHADHLTFREMESVHIVKCFLHHFSQIFQVCWKTASCSITAMHFCNSWPSKLYQIRANSEALFFIMSKIEMAKPPMAMFISQHFSKLRDTVQLWVLTRLVLKHMQAFSDCLWRGFLILGGWRM